MKRILIDVRNKDNKLGTAIKTEGYLNDNLSHQLEILGIVENISTIIKERIKKLAEVNI